MGAVPAVLIRVADTGIGIPARHLPHVFDIFYRVQDPAAKDVPGTGLGLAIAKSIADGHDGRILVESSMAPAACSPSSSRSAAKPAPRWLDPAGSLVYGGFVRPGMDRVRLLILTAALASHVLLSAVVFASPPDPIGLSGVFDDDDNDDVVLLMMAMCAVVPSPPPAPNPLGPVVTLPVPHGRRGSPAAPLYARQIRAPPAS